LLGATQALYEAGMWIFVFMWTPALETPGGPEIPHGWIFAAYMVCIWGGSSSFTVAIQNQGVIERNCLWLFLVATVALMMPILSENVIVRLLGFLVFEVCCGIYYPSMGTLRSRYIPQDVRATVMNIFAIPVNLIVVSVLANLKSLSGILPFYVCVCCMGFAHISQWCFLRSLSNPHYAAVASHDFPVREAETSVELLAKNKEPEFDDDFSQSDAVIKSVNAIGHELANDDDAV